MCLRVCQCVLADVLIVCVERACHCVYLIPSSRPMSTIWQTSLPWALLLLQGDEGERVGEGGGEGRGKGEEGEGDGEGGGEEEE